MLTSVNKTAVGTTNFVFDDNGNMTSADGESVSYNAFNKPLMIQGSAGTSSFSYGANLMRYRQQTPQGTTIYYIDKLMEIETSASITDYRHCLGSVATMADTSGFATEARVPNRE